MLVLFILQIENLTNLDILFNQREFDLIVSQ